MSLLETFNWPKAAEAFSNEIPLEDLHPEVIDYLYQHRNEPWAIACSGGGDSLALLLLIYRYFFEKVEGLYVFHYNHKLRGAESDREEAFVRTCAAEMKLQLIVGEGDALIENRSEAILRKNRHRFFNESLILIEGRILLLGHQRDDVGEMMLMRLARGSGTGGVCAPRPVHYFQEGKVHVRPLLNLGKALLLEKLINVGITWCEDSSNLRGGYFRNRVRRDVIPHWERVCTGDLWKGIERSRGLLEEDDVALEYWIESILGTKVLVKGMSLPINLFVGKPKALYRRILHKWLNVNGFSKNFNTISFDHLLYKVMNDEAVSIKIGINYKIVLKDGSLIIKVLDNTRYNFIEQNIEPGEIMVLGNGRFLEVNEVVLSEELKDKIFSGNISPGNEVYLNYDDKFDLDFTVRLWKAGDRYRALGSPGKRKLQDMFTDKKIEIEERRTLPIICERRHGIVWCPGLPIVESLRIEVNTVSALKLTYR